MNLQSSTKLYVVKSIYVKCVDIDYDHIPNVTCHVKSQRNSSGLTTLYIEQWNMDHVMSRIQLFFQNSAGRFNPYILDLTYNFCDRKKQAKSLSKFIDIIDVFLATSGQNRGISDFHCPYNVSLFHYQVFFVLNLIFTIFRAHSV